MLNHCLKWGKFVLCTHLSTPDRGLTRAHTRMQNIYNEHEILVKLAVRKSHKLYSASRGVPVYAPAFTDTHCAYPRRVGQAELTWVIGSVTY